MGFCFKSGQDYYTGLMKEELCTDSAVLFNDPLFYNLHLSGQHAWQISLSCMLQHLRKLSKLIREIEPAIAVSIWQKAGFSRPSLHNSSFKITHLKEFLI